MAVDGRTPVLVGVGNATQRHDDPAEALEAVDLMVGAARAAADDAGHPDLLRRVGWIGVPTGTWSYSDAGGLVAERLALAPVPSVRADVGILQQTLISAAVRAVRDGQVDVALVVGGETRHRTRRSEITGVPAPETDQRGARPDVHLRADDFGILPVEIERGAVTPVVAYALIESALRAAAGRSPEEHRRHLGARWEGMARVAVDNPWAWDRSGPDGATIVEPSPANRMLATPYTRLLSSQWNVDQAAALLVCSLAAARAAGVAPDRFVFPLAACTSDRAVPVTERAELHRCPGAGLVARRALALAGLDDGQLSRVDLYSCFPAAVETYAAELGRPAGAPVTVTGGMTFAGGPFNSYVLQSTARMAEVLRADGTGTGLVSSVSGFLHRQGVGLWATAPPPRFLDDDVSDDTGRAVATRPVVPDAEGRATVAGCTVVHDGGRPTHGLVVADLDGGGRALATVRDADLVADMVTGEWVGRTVAVSADGTVTA